MKKLFLGLILLMSVCSLKAQNHYIGGSLGINYQFVDGSSQVAFVLSPEFGYHFNGHWTMGGALEMFVSSNGGYNMNGMAVYPYVRGTFASARNFRFFAEGVVGYMLMGDGGGVGHGFTAAVRPGLLYKAKKIDVVARLNLIQYSYVGEIGSLVNLTFGSTLSVGVVYNF